MNALVKWVAGTALAAGATAALLVPKASNDRDAVNYRDRSDTLNMNYNTARDRLLMLRRVVGRGEARAMASELTGVQAGEPYVRIDPKVPKETGAAIVSRFSSELAAVKALPTKYPIALIIADDTTLAVGGLYTQAIVLPEKPGDPCTVVLRIPRNRVNNWAGMANARITSTCAFYAAFGQPGAGTQDWLTANRGISARWIQLPPAYQQMDIDQRLYSLSNYGWSPTVESTLRCRLEILEACEELVGPESTEPSYFDEFRGDRTDRSALRTEFPGVDVSNSGGWWEDRRIRSGALGALANELGPERFGAIWRDPRGLREALASQSGRPFARWVADYVAARVSARPRGPGISSFATFAALAILVAAGGLAIFRAPRRMT